MPKTYQKKAKLTFYKAPHIPEDTVKHRYQMFETTPLGGLSQKSSMLKTNHRPAESVTDEAQQDTAASIPLLDGDEASNSEVDPLLDAAYLEHLEETGSDAIFRRVWAQGVRLQIHVLYPLSASSI